MGTPPSGMMPPPGPAPGMYAPPPMAPKQRPIGVTILAILVILGGIFMLFGGLVLLGVGAVAGAGGAGIFGGLVAVIGGLLALFGLLWVIAGIGLWRLKGWAWWLAVIVSVINLAISGVSMDFVGVAIALLILIYLVVVRGSFGIGGAKPAGM